jgi:hypothetical protein
MYTNYEDKKFFLLMILYFTHFPDLKAEQIFVKYRGFVTLDSFVCQDISSSFIKRLCYDQKRQYMILRLNNTYYHYCGIKQTDISNFLEAESKGVFYNTNIKGLFDCRLSPTPSF